MTTNASCVRDVAAAAADVAAFVDDEDDVAAGPIGAAAGAANVQQFRM